MKTKVFIEEFKGQEILAIFEVDDNGNKTNKYPIISFAGKKAKVISSHADEISEFAEQQAVAKAEETF